MMQDFVELQAIFDWKFSILILQEMDEIEIQYKSTTAAAAASTKNLKDYNISTPLEYHVVGMKNSAQCYFTVDLLSFAAIQQRVMPQPPNRCRKSLSCHAFPCSLMKKRKQLAIHFFKVRETAIRAAAFLLSRLPPVHFLFSLCSYGLGRDSSLKLDLPLACHSRMQNTSKVVIEKWPPA